jgi:hypothetical protein
MTQMPEYERFRKSPEYRRIELLRGVIFETMARSKALGQAELLIKLLTLRFGMLTDAVDRKVRYAGVAQIGAVAERILTSHTLEEALVPLFSSEAAPTPRKQGEAA